MEKELREALVEVMEWIKGWDPNFIYDEAWPATEAKVQKALTNTKTPVPTRMEK